MKTYSLLNFLSEPIDLFIDNEEDYCFTTLQSATSVTSQNALMIDRITIPIIQRDYVQGRKENATLLGEFVDKLFLHLESEKLLKLDFVYGSLKTNGETVFLPLDGQQRLTTLYLLHWFIIKKEADKSSEHYIRFIQLISKFSYETRDTSRRFFLELANFELTGNVAQDIEDSYWFNDHFKLDPTITAILNTLKYIEITYNASPKKGMLLDSLLNDIIVFYVLPMDQFKLTDDLYIKLNARGKILSSFENFKADFIGFIKGAPSFQDNRELQKGITLQHHEIIANKFDNDWSNLFWTEIKNKEYQSENSALKSIDPYFFRFIHRVLINNYIITYSGKDILNDSVYNQLLNKEETLQYSSFDFYQKNNLLPTEVIQDMERLLDYYLKYNSLIKKLIEPLWESDLHWDIFKKGNIMEDRMVFDAVNMYILNNPCGQFDQDGFKDWIRVVWNLFSDPDIRSITANKTVMVVIRAISKYSGAISASLVAGELDEYISSLDNIHKIQLEEERLKAKLMAAATTGPQWKSEIFKAESHPLFTGNIGFMLANANSPDTLRQRFSLAAKLFIDKKPSELLQGEKHALMRYIITQISSWDELAGFNFSDNEINWKTYLRRSPIVKPIVLDLIESKDIAQVTIKLKKALAAGSVMQGTTPGQYQAHKNLFSDNAFHTWMQADKVNKVKYIGPRIFTVRPSAWHSKIMIDGYRNEVTQALIHNLGLDDQKCRCGNADYFKGQVYDLFMVLDTMKVTFHFDINNKLHVGLFGELNPQLAATLPLRDGWVEIHTFDMDTIKSSGEVKKFLETVENNITNDQNSRIKKLFENNIV